MARAAAPPAGYAAAHVGSTDVVAIPTLLPGLREILASRTLYAHAAAHPARRVRTGRAPVYIVPLEGCERPVVVRHSWHGGALARLTGDRFIASTRAPRELAISLRLARLGVPTPRIVAYAVYHAGPFLRRSDVLTEEIEDSADLAAILTGTRQVVPRAEAIAATEGLLMTMARAGIRHPDLNLKNILVARAASHTATAFLLDVDRVHIDPARARAASANAARLVRSANKWRRRRAPITDAEIAMFQSAALGGPA
jgi:hypothetical protein